MSLALEEIFVQFLQAFVNALPQKSFDALFVGFFDFIDVLEAIAQSALFKHRDSGVGIDLQGHGFGED
jgi:hypothetical protein